MPSAKTSATHHRKKRRRRKSRKPRHVAPVAPKRPALSRPPAGSLPSTPPPAAPLPTDPPAVPPPAVPPTPDPTPPGPAATTPVVAHFTRADAERLLWRAGFGPHGPGADPDALVAMGVDAAVHALVHPTGDAQLVGPDPHDQNGNPLAPEDLWGHAHCFWLDRMVRSDQPLVERMALVFHDWFATSIEKVGRWRLMLDQIDLFRRSGLGSFTDLAQAVAADPAMIVWLDCYVNTRWDPNENFARELMELFTLGANRGAYTEQDVRELARALTGWAVDWTAIGFDNFRYDANRHDTGTKTVFGRSGAFTIQDGVRLCLENPFHPSFFVTKLWSYFVPTPPDAATQAALEQIYTSGGRAVAPVLEAILKHPDLYDGPSMVKPPVVETAGLLRALGRGIDTDAWSWLDLGAGQFLLAPPNVAGWDDDRWLDTSTWTSRYYIAVWALEPTQLDPWTPPTPYDPTETPEVAVARALDHLGNPRLPDDTQATLLDFARTTVPDGLASWAVSPYRAMRQNALRLLVATSADHHVC